MKKIILFLCVLSLIPSICKAQLGTKSMTDAQQLGAMAGIALACNAGSRLDDFELIASYIMGNSAATEEARTTAFKEYAAEKLRTYNLQRDQKPTPCPEALQHFYNLPIFASVVYADGTVKLPDGKIIKPKTAAQKKRAQNEPKRNYMKPGRGQGY